jgi:hypothetical protein
MSWYLLLTNNVDYIDTQTSRFVEKCSRYFDLEFGVYRPLPFVDHTGLTETVQDEIDFVVGCQQSASGAHLNANDFVREWHLQGFRDYRVVHLSGGWRKFLGLSLFTNQKLPAKLYFDVASHLAEERLRLLLRQLENQGNDQVVIFCDYDSLLFYRLAGDRFLLLLDTGDRVEVVKDLPRHALTARQSNYGDT